MVTTDNFPIYDGDTISLRCVDPDKFMLSGDSIVQCDGSGTGGFGYDEEPTCTLIIGEQVIKVALLLIGTLLKSIATYKN